MPSPESAEDRYVHCVKLSKKRVWLGLKLPGRRMIERAASAANVQPLFRSGRLLNECYQGPPWKGLLSAAVCLDALLDEEDVEERIDALADVCEFLKLRYRAHGLEEPPAEELLEDLAEGVVPDEVMPERPDLAINYLVCVLDALSQDEKRIGNAEAFATAAETLRDLSDDTGRLLAEQQYSDEDWAELSSQWDDAAGWRRERAA